MTFTSWGVVPSWLSYPLELEKRNISLWIASLIQSDYTLEWNSSEKTIFLLFNYQGPISVVLQEFKIYHWSVTSTPYISSSKKLSDHRPKKRIKFWNKGLLFIIYSSFSFFLSCILFCFSVFDWEGEGWRSYQSTEVRCNGPERLKSSLSEAITPYVLYPSSSWYPQKLFCNAQGQKVFRGHSRFALRILDWRTKLAKQFDCNQSQNNANPLENSLFALKIHLNNNHFKSTEDSFQALWHAYYFQGMFIYIKHNNFNRIFCLSGFSRLPQT